MTMDFLFETSDDVANIHLPVEMSTRERVVQAWAHQRLLDSAFGSGSYKGIMVLFSETKLDSRGREVIEICVPDQWLVYQTLLSKMDRIYYFDMPVRYRELTNDFSSTIQIKPFYEFLTEIKGVVGREFSCPVRRDRLSEPRSDPQDQPTVSSRPVSGIRENTSGFCGHGPASAIC